jgi:hypothetical protein
MRRIYLCLVGLLIASGLLVPQLAGAQPDRLCFPDVPGVTNCIEGRFREYWEQNGGLPVFGYPLSAATTQQTAEGSFLTQDFERNRFELHPDNPEPYDVLLGRLGDVRLKQQQRDWFTFPKGQETDGCLHFKETGHSLCNQEGNIGFRSFWEGHRLNDRSLNRFAQSLALFGMPLSEPAMEKNAAGQTVLTQWFERARFEFHPNNAPQHKVLLGLLGVETRGAATPTPTPAPTADPACAGVPAPTNARVTPNCLRYGKRFYLEVFGFKPNERISFWVTPENGVTISARASITVDANGRSAGYIYTDDFFQHQLRPGNYVLVARPLNGSHLATAPFRVLP